MDVIEDLFFPAVGESAPIRPMRKVIVIGCPGCGKSVFAKALHKATGLPLYHMDSIIRKEDGSLLPGKEITDRITSLLPADEWILEGEHGASLAMRLQLCDTVFFLDYPPEVCAAGYLAKRMRQKKDADEPPAGLDWMTMEYILRYRSDKRPLIESRLSRCADKNIHVFRGRGDADAFLSHLQKDLS